MAYTGLGENTYYVRWCDLRNKKCSEIWPEGCPQVQRKTGYAKAMKAYNERFSIGVSEYYAGCAKTESATDMYESAEYAEAFAGPEPKMEDF
jgi:hypothetical protein